MLFLNSNLSNKRLLLPVTEYSNYRVALHLTPSTTWKLLNDQNSLYLPCTSYHKIHKPRGQVLNHVNNMVQNANLWWSSHHRLTKMLTSFKQSQEQIGYASIDANWPIGKVTVPHTWTSLTFLQFLNQNSNHMQLADLVSYSTTQTLFPPSFVEFQTQKRTKALESDLQLISFLFHQFKDNKNEKKEKKKRGKVFIFSEKQNKHREQNSDLKGSSKKIKINKKR